MVAVPGPSPSTAHGVYNATPPTGADQQAMPLQTDSAGNLKVVTAGTPGTSEPVISTIPSSANVTLLTNASASTVTGVATPGGTYNFAVSGTFGGTTATLSVTGADGATYVPVVGSGLTANGAFEVDIGAGSLSKCILTGGTPSAIYSVLERVR